jgi:hypothetical protein
MSAVLRAVWSNKALWIVHCIANAAILAALYGWLWIPDRTVTDLVLSALAAIALLLLISWLHASTLEHFRLNHETGRVRMAASFRPSLRRIAGFALWLLVLCAAIVLVLQLRSRLDPMANWIASALTLRLRRPITPASIATLLSTIVAAAAFMFIPFLLLLAWNRRWSRTLLFSYIATFLVCAYVPYRLIWWVPNAGGFNSESASMAIRFGFAYLLAITGWLVLASTLGQIQSRR